MFDSVSTDIILIVLGTLLYLFMGLCFNKQYQRNRVETYMLKFEIRKLTAVHAYYTALQQEPYNREFIAYHAPEFLVFDENEFGSEDNSNNANSNKNNNTNNDDENSIKQKDGRDANLNDSLIKDEEKQEMSMSEKLLHRQQNQNKKMVQRLPLFERAEGMEDNTRATLLVVFFWPIACCFILRNEDEMNEGRKDIKKLRRSINKLRQQLKPSYNNERGYETDRTFSEINQYARKFSGVVELTSNFSAARKLTNNSHLNDNFLSLFRRNANSSQNLQNMASQRKESVTGGGVSAVNNNGNNNNNNTKQPKVPARNPEAFKSHISYSDGEDPYERRQAPPLTIDQRQNQHGAPQVSDMCEPLHEKNQIQQKINSVEESIEVDVNVADLEENDTVMKRPKKNAKKQKPPAASPKKKPKESPSTARTDTRVSPENKRHKKPYNEDDEKDIDSSGSD